MLLHIDWICFLFLVSSANLCCWLYLTCPHVFSPLWPFTYLHRVPQSLIMFPVTACTSLECSEWCVADTTQDIIRKRNNTYCQKKRHISLFFSIFVFADANLCMYSWFAFVYFFLSLTAFPSHFFPHTLTPSIILLFKYTAWFNS